MTEAFRTFAKPPLPWRRALPALVLVLAAILAIYYDTAKAMVSIWARSDTFAHAFLVVPIVLWLVWRKRHALALLQPKPALWPLLAVAAVAFAWLLGELASINSVTQLAMTALLVLAVPAVLGTQVARTIAFPLAFLFFAVPVGEFLLPQLMSWTADFTVLALRATGIPVYREGNQFTIPSGSWSVIEACSGVRYLIASFMVGTLFAYLNYRSPRRRWSFAAISLAVPIVANWIRAYLIVLLGHLSGNKLAVGADHLIYGWLFFGVVIGLMYALGTLWAEPEAPHDAAATRVPALPIASPFEGSQRLYVVTTAAVLLAIAPHLLLSEFGSVDDTVAPQLAEVTDLAGGWQVSDAAVSDWKPAFANPSAQLTSTYRSQDREIGVYIGYYRAQSYRRKLVSSANELVKSTDPEWALVSTDLGQTLELPSQTLRVRAAELRRLSSLGGSGQRLVAWQVYWVGDRLTGSDQWAKAYGALERLLRRGDDSAVIILYAVDEPTGTAGQSLALFAQTNLSSIVTQLRKSRDGARASVAANNYENPSETRK
jgi:exosortase A